MFCPNCGTKLPDNARFCSSCGQKIETLAGQSQSVDDLVNSITPEQMKEIAKGMVDNMLSPLEEAVADYSELAKNGKVMLEDLNWGIKYLELAKDFGKGLSTPLDKNRYYLALLVYQDAKDVFNVHYERWNKALKPVDTDLLIGDFAQFLNGGLKELMVHTALIDNTVQDRIMAHMGIVRFLEQVLLTNVLLCLKLANRDISPEGKAMLIQQHGEELVKVAFERFEAWYNDLITESKNKNS